VPERGIQMQLVDPFVPERGNGGGWMGGISGGAGGIGVRTDRQVRRLRDVRQPPARGQLPGPAGPEATDSR